MNGQSQVRVDVIAFNDCDDEELLAFLGELRSADCDIRIERFPSNAGGPDDIFFIVSIAGSIGLPVAIYLKSFLESLGTEHAKALNTSLLKVIRSGRGKNNRAGMYSLKIGGSDIWFHLRQPLTPEEFARRMGLAAKLLPPEMDVSGTGPENSNHSFYWDVETDSWRLMPLGEYGPNPPDDAG